ncbi:scavenger receptor class F member 2-like [Ostrea edulis]|uniref:scavenger receptor class F member 2-like n=1 Tax=Ostrea edulis TaxID=37623 RepID=UPI0024AEC96B|nr:scavenger receptor class F member 2-like [Ostrea edulis]
MNWVLRFALMTFYFFGADSRGLCDNREHGCCSGQVWNETLEICTDCTAGYTGRFCDIRCQYPYYGMQCLLTCNPPHSRDHYDFKTGCVHKEFTVLFTSPATDYSTVMQRTDSDNSTTKPIGNCVLI